MVLPQDTTRSVQEARCRDDGVELIEAIQCDTEAHRLRSDVRCSGLHEVACGDQGAAFVVLPAVHRVSSTMP